MLSMTDCLVLDMMMLFQAEFVPLCGMLRTPFRKLVRECLDKVCAERIAAGDTNILPYYRIQEEAFLAVQTAMEASLQLAFEDAVILSRHAGRATVMSDDWWTGLELRSMRGDDPLLHGLQRRSLFISLYFIIMSQHFRFAAFVHLSLSKPKTVTLCKISLQKETSQYCPISRVIWLDDWF